MHFSNSIFLALAASAFAAPMPSEKAGAVAPREADQLLSGLLGEVTGGAGTSKPSTIMPNILPLKRDAVAKGGRPPGSPNPVTTDPNHPRDAARGGRPAGSPNPETNNPNHPRDAARGGRPAGSPNPVTNNPNHPRDAARGSPGAGAGNPVWTSPIHPRDSGSNPATHCC